MRIEIPPGWPSWAVELLVGHIPNGDPQLLRDCADTWAQTATELRALSIQLGAVEVADATEGSAGDAFRRAVDELREDCRALAEPFESLAKYLYGAANDLELQIYIAFGTLAVMIAQFFIAVATMNAPGAALVRVEGEIAIKLTWRTLLKWLRQHATQFLLEHPPVKAVWQGAKWGALLGGGLNLGAELVQVVQGHRDSIDWKAVGEATAVGATSGAAGAGLAHRLAPGLRRWSNRFPEQRTRVAAHVTGVLVVGAAAGAAGGVVGAIVLAEMEGRQLNLRNLAEAALAGLAPGAVGAAGAAAKVGVGVAKVGARVGLPAGEPVVAGLRGAPPIEPVAARGVEEPVLPVNVDSVSDPAHSIAQLHNSEPIGVEPEKVGGISEFPDGRAPRPTELTAAAMALEADLGARVDEIFSEDKELHALAQELGEPDQGYGEPNRGTTVEDDEFWQIVSAGFGEDGHDPGPFLGPPGGGSPPLAPPPGAGGQSPGGWSGGQPQGGALSTAFTPNPDGSAVPAGSAGAQPGAGATGGGATALAGGPPGGGSAGQTGGGQLGGGSLGQPSSPQNPQGTPNPTADPGGGGPITEGSLLSGGDHPTAHDLPPGLQGSRDGGVATAVDVDAEFNRLTAGLGLTAPEHTPPHMPTEAPATASPSTTNEPVNPTPPSPTAKEPANPAATTPWTGAKPESPTPSTQHGATETPGPTAAPTNTSTPIEPAAGTTLEQPGSTGTPKTSTTTPATTDNAIPPHQAADPPPADTSHPPAPQQTHAALTLQTPPTPAPEIALTQHHPTPTFTTSNPTPASLTATNGPTPTIHDQTPSPPPEFTQPEPDYIRTTFPGYFPNPTIDSPTQFPIPTPIEFTTPQGDYVVLPGVSGAPSPESPRDIIPVTPRLPADTQTHLPAESPRYRPPVEMPEPAQPATPRTPPPPPEYLP
ncbi:WXG100 family type VII secretion target, partial [Nocardia heshunensis]